MKHLHKIATAFCAAALGLLSLTGCEGGDIYNIDSPDWISEKIDSINKAKNAGQEEVWTDLNEDVYTIGNTDFSSGWWSAFSKYYQIPDGKCWHAVFNLSVNPNDNTYYKNFALILSNDADRGSADYKEYGAIRYDYTGDSTAYNSQWGNTKEGAEYVLPFRFSESNQIMSPVDNQDKGLQQLGGQVKLSVDRSNPDTFKVKITNGTVTKTYTQPYPLPNRNADASDNNIRCFLVPEGAFINFQSSNIEPIGGYTSAKDKQPVSMTLNNVPDFVLLGTPVDSAMKNITATVTYEEGVTQTVPASELLFVDPGMNTEGEKTLVAIYNKTFKGEGATTPIYAEAKFNVSYMPKSIEVTKRPTRGTYYLCTTQATRNVAHPLFDFDPTGLEVTATFPDGSKAVYDNSRLTFSKIQGTLGQHTVVITAGNGASATVKVKVAESNSTFVTPDPTILGAEDNTSGWWSAHLTSDINVPAGQTRQFSFTNYTSGAKNWNNFVVVLRNQALAEYGVFRADNYGWQGTKNSNDDTSWLGAHGCSYASNWTSWLAAMNGAKVNVWVTNCGNGSADVQSVITGTDGNTYVLYYLGVKTVDPNDFNVDFTVDGCHLSFSNTSFAKRHAPRHRR